MAGLALSGGTLLSVLQGKRVYQPIWQIIAVQTPSPGSNTSNQLLVSDGKYLTYSVSLHPSCHVTFDKSSWKNQNSGKSAEDVLSSYKYPYVKIVDYVVKTGDKEAVIFISKVKLMGFEKGTKAPDILRGSEVDVINGRCEVVVRSREGLEEFDVPGIEICDPGAGYGDPCEELVSYSMSDKQPIALMESVMATKSLLAPGGRPRARAGRLTRRDLLEGEMAALGPRGLNIVTLCGKCEQITYATDSRISQFKPPAKILLAALAEILPNNASTYEFCACDDENEQFRKEFQNKCMVVNQDTSSGADRKVQCILVSKEKELKDEDEEDDITQLKLTNGDSGKGSSDSEESIKCLVPITKKVVRVSHKLRLCENCGVEERDMAACKHCAKVFYCSASCKKANVKNHTNVCRAYITVRRFNEEKTEFAKKINEPDDGCGTCGFWRDSLEACNKCNKVSYCSYRCKDKASEKHKPVCEAFTVIQNYRKNFIRARTQEVD